MISGGIFQEFGKRRFWAGPLLASVALGGLIVPIAARAQAAGRLAWYSAYDNPLLVELVGGADPISGYALNVPYAWGETLTLDAYVKFRLNDRFSAELVGTNLTDKYYADPLTRALNPAPGRTVRLSLTGRF